MDNNNKHGKKQTKSIYQLATIMKKHHKDEIQKHHHLINNCRRQQRILIATHRFCD
jgi:hypothetical protein